MTEKDIIEVSSIIGRIAECNSEFTAYFHKVLSSHCDDVNEMKVKDLALAYLAASKYYNEKKRAGETVL